MTEEKEVKWPETLGTVDSEEAETHISWMRGDNRAKIYTSDLVVFRKIKKLAEGSKDGEWKLVGISRSQRGEAIGIIAEGPRKAISLRAGAKRELTDEQRAELSERMKKLAAEGRNKH